MDWSELFTALGGGPLAVALLGIGWLIRHLMQKNDTLTALLMDRKDDEIRAAERREIAIHQSLSAVTDIVKEYARSK